MNGHMCKTAVILLALSSFTASCFRNEYFDNLFNQPRKAKGNASRDASHSCRYRDIPTLYPPDYWVYLTGAMCYSWSQDERLNLPRVPLNITLVAPGNVTYQIPYMIINGTNVLFNYSDEITVSTYIAPLFRTEKYLEKWISCSREASECCTDFMNEENVYPTEEYPCPALWDGWACIPPGHAGETVKVPCPPHTYTPDDIVCSMDAEKYCLADGNWNHTTNYVVCAAAAVYRRRHNFHIIVLYVSIALSFPAIVIFYSFQKLRILRIILHRNLLLAIVVKNILTIMSKSLVILDALKPTSQSNNVLNDSYAGCKILAFIENVSKNAVFTLMLVDAYYLHKSIVRVFSQDHKVYMMYLVAAICSVTPSLIWAILMASSGRQYCWMVDSDSWYQWITDGYKYFVLALNTLLLIDIIRVLIMKRSRNNTRQSRSTLKAALFLVPLFGLPLLLTGQRNLLDSGTCTTGDIYYYITYGVEAAQGIVVALFFCYLNTEVHREFQNAYRKLRVRLEGKYGLKFGGTEGRRRTTGFTNVRSSVDPDRSSFVTKNLVTDSVPPEQKVKGWLSLDNTNEPTQNDIRTDQSNI